VNLLVGRVGTFTAKELRKAGAQKTIKSFKELYDIVKNLKGKTFVICDWDGTVINSIKGEGKLGYKTVAAPMAIKKFLKVDKRKEKEIIREYLRTSGVPFIGQIKVILKKVFKTSNDKLALKIREKYYELIYNHDYPLFKDAKWLKKINEKAIVIISSSMRHKKLREEVKRKLGWKPRLVLGAWGSFKKGERHYKHILRKLGKPDNAIIVGDTLVDMKEWKKCIKGGGGVA